MITTLIKFANWLDRHAFLGYQLWEFSLRNTTRSYPWFFLCKVLLPNSIKAFKGVLYYRKLVQLSGDKPLVGTVDFVEIQNILEEQDGNKSRFLIAPGFCMKPFDEIKQKSICPAGQFTHRCLVLENREMLAVDQNGWIKPCNECDIGSLAQICSKLHACFYIMTSAIDIAYDIYLPAITGQRLNSGIFLLCAYSSEAFTFGLSTCHIKGNLINFCKGACENHEDFTNADVGIKQKQTFVDESDFNKLKKMLIEIADKKYKDDNREFSYDSQDHVYHYVKKNFN